MSVVKIGSEVLHSDKFSRLVTEGVDPMRRHHVPEETLVSIRGDIKHMQHLNL